MYHLQKTDRRMSDSYSKTRLAKRHSAYSKPIIFILISTVAKILAVSEMNSNVIQTKIRFLNPRKVLDLHAKGGNLLSIPRIVCSAGTPRGRRGNSSKGFKTDIVEQTFPLILPHILQLS